MQIYLSRPDITDREIQAACDVLRSPDIALGPKVEEFERAFAEYIGTRRAVTAEIWTTTPVAL